MHFILKHQFVQGCRFLRIDKPSSLITQVQPRIKHQKKQFSPYSTLWFMAAFNSMVLLSRMQSTSRIQLPFTMSSKDNSQKQDRKLVQCTLNKLQPSHPYIHTRTNTHTHTHTHTHTQCAPTLPNALQTKSHCIHVIPSGFP